MQERRRFAVLIREMRETAAALIRIPRSQALGSPARHGLKNDAIDQTGQKAKYSLEADVFRFGPNNGHRSIGSACPFGAKCGSGQTASIRLERDGCRICDEAGAKLGQKMHRTLLAVRQSYLMVTVIFSETTGGMNG